MGVNLQDIYELSKTQAEEMFKKGGLSGKLRA
jgi:hypothetical protein